MIGKTVEAVLRAWDIYLGAKPMTTLTPRIAAELLSHEGIVCEAYKDSVGVWTWSVGITDASGHSVGRYKDNPQSIEKCLEIYLWALRERYLPTVLQTFAGHKLTEAQLGAALSFHFNTGAIHRADWVRKWKAGDKAGARAAFMNWSKPKEIIPRREAERDLFFDGKWSGDGTALVFDVAKPSYFPVQPKRIDIMPELERLL